MPAMIRIRRIEYGETQLTMEVDQRSVREEGHLHQA